MSTPLPPGYFDHRPLVDPVDPAAVAAFARAQRAQNPTSGGQIAGIVIAIVAVAIFVVPVLFLMAMGLGVTLGATAGSAPDGGLGPGAGIGALIGGAVMFLLVGGAGAGIGIAISRSIRNRRIAQYRIAHFAAANGMAYIGTVPNPPLPGMIFHQGSGRAASNAIRGLQPRFVEFGNHQYTTGSGKNQTTHHWGYVAVKLDVPLPHIVLDALGNNTLGSNLPASFRKEQRLSLEGDFDRHFSLYCPTGYETDALYLFTPDVMVRFIDHAAQLDVEIVDDWLFLYTPRPASTLDPATWAWLFGAVGALLTKLDQWARWRDDRLRGLPAVPPAAAPGPLPSGAPAATGASAPLPAAGGPGTFAAPALPFTPPPDLLTPPPPGVAPPGQRLRRTGPWVAIAIVLGVLALTLLGPLLLLVVPLLIAL
ncbi:MULTISPECIES: hypothetical protein [unclassified Microbacterium]|uniref:hypothetical protein n=1 Tax=unclassified Microbacterium TaxID=2609290 RepID=UPI0030100B15